MKGRSAGIASTSRSTAGWRGVPGLRVIERIGALRLLRVLAVVFVVGFTVAVLLRESVDPLATGRDPVTYLAAGERLNDGHPLYALSPGDRPVPLSPPYWSVPLLAPPPIAVAWRPLALAGEAAALAWWAGGVTAIVTFVAWLLRRGTAPVLLATVALTPALALTALSGNASAFVVPLLALAWVARDRPWVVASIVVGAAVIKLTPVLLILWLLAAGRRSALRDVVAVAAVVAVASLLGAGVGNHVDWLASVPSSAPMPLSLAAWTRLPPIVVAALVAAVAGLVALAARRRGREDVAFGAAIVGTALATPAFYFAALATLVVATVPWLSRPGKADPER